MKIKPFRQFSLRLLCLSYRSAYKSASREYDVTAEKLPKYLEELAYVIEAYKVFTAQTARHLP